MKKVSFTTRVKEDITFNVLEYGFPRKRAILAALIKHAGRLRIREGEEQLIISTENAKVAKYSYQLVKELFEVEPTFSYLTNRKFGKKMKFKVVVSSRISDIFEELKLDFYATSVTRKIVYSDDTLAGYFTGAFIGSGSMTSPLSKNYHLEIVTNNEKYATWMTNALERFTKTRFNAKVTKRRDKFIVYLKRSDQIAEFLIFIGAANASLEFESIRIDRDMQNTTNRMFICDEANYKKTLKSSARHIENIKIVERHYGEVPEGNLKLAALMKLRVEHDDATLNELAELLTEELGQEKPISKGNVNHLFIKLRELAAPYKEQNEHQ
ncbi:MAG TPA: DNA-binding protein WhiA [Bacilli bacterium]|nr:DNA-binding protein WhiA [Bacilli bacterium]